MNTTDPIRTLDAVIHHFRSFEAIARKLRKPDGSNPTGKAVSKWFQAGKLPRTEATGETTYARQLAAIEPRIDADALIATTMADPEEAAA